MKSVGFLVPKDHLLVFVFVDDDGRKRISYNRMPSKDVEITGVFLASKKTYEDRLKRGRFYPKDNTRDGVPEGFSLERQYKWDSKTETSSFTGKYYLVRTHSPYERHQYKLKLLDILKKAKEFVAAGIDKKAALIAARKCACRVH